MQIVVGNVIYVLTDESQYVRLDKNDNLHIAGGRVRCFSNGVFLDLTGDLTEPQLTQNLNVVVVALFHDVVITVGLFCLTGRTFSMPMVAALLTIIGYSINDTIVVFDRIRENRKLGGAGKLHYFDMINLSVNQTLSRTILTAGTTLISALALYFFGGHVINDFAFTFVVGVITGTFSSIYITSTVVLWFHRAEEARLRAAETAEAARA